MDDLKERWLKAAKRRDDVAAKYQRLLGKREQAVSALETVKAAIQAKGVDPEKIDDVIQDKREKLSKEVEAFEASVADAEHALERYKV